MLRTPAGRRRLEILEWLKAEDGATAEAIAARLGISREATETHLTLLTAIGLLRTERIQDHVHYRRDEMRIAEVARLFEKGW